ncbi:MAG: winged helix DNA-binding protein [Gudongella sp.]|nr:winged helix DNA-binding protein [Gudongella sp.]
MATRGEQTLMELRKLWMEGNGFEMPFGSTQDGIAENVGITRGHMSLVLKDLEEKGYVKYIMAHAGRGKARRRCYILTPKGYMRSSEIMNSEVM